MQTQKPQKLDLSTDYPCPCPRRRGRLVPIVLTDAFGCDRCQHIFVVNETGDTIERLSTGYPPKQIWRWTGQSWNLVSSRWRENYIYGLLMALLALFAMMLVVLLSPSSGAATASFPWMVVIIIALLVGSLFYWAYRR